METGWIRLYRKSEESRAFQNADLWKVWSWCLMQATHKQIWMPVKIAGKSSEVKLEPGQFIFGRKSAAKKLKMKPSSLRDRMQKLEKLQQIAQKPTPNYTIVTIRNWKKYQPIQDTPSDHNPTTVRPQSDTNNNNKNINTKNQQVEKGIVELCQLLTQEKIFPKAFSFAGRMRKENMHPAAILYSLTQCAQYKPKDPYPYCKNICTKESPNFRESEHHLKSREQFGEGRQD